MHLSCFFPQRVYITDPTASRTRARTAQVRDHAPALLHPVYYPFGTGGGRLNIRAITSSGSWTCTTGLGTGTGAAGADADAEPGSIPFRVAILNVRLGSRLSTGPKASDCAPSIVTPFGAAEAAGVAGAGRGAEAAATRRRTLD